MKVVILLDAVVDFLLLVVVDSVLDGLVLVLENSRKFGIVACLIGFKRGKFDSRLLLGLVVEHVVGLYGHRLELFLLNVGHTVPFITRMKILSALV